MRVLLQGKISHFLGYPRRDVPRALWDVPRTLQDVPWTLQDVSWTLQDVPGATHCAMITSDTNSDYYYF